MDIISKKLANERLYAYSKGRFWFWDEARNVWKESHLLSKRYGLAHAADGSLTPEDYLTNPAEFQALEEYEVDFLMQNALKNAQPCKNAPIDPVEEPEASNTPAVQEAKPLTTIPDEMRPAFDYSGLSEQTVSDLHLAEEEYQRGRKLAERGLIHMGDSIAIAHDALCGTVVAQCDNGRFAKKEDTFRAWCVSIGITKDTAYRLLQVSALMDNSSPRQQKILKELSPTLLYAVAKPSAPAELVEQVKSGDITSNKQYQDALKQLKAEKERAESRALDAESRLKSSCIAEQNAREAMQAAEAQRDAALADVDGLKAQNEKLTQNYNEMYESRIAANLQRQKAEAERDRAAQRAAKAEEALKHQPIAGVVDEEEVDRRAHQQAYSIAADMTEELKADKDKLLQDKAELEKQLAEARAVVPADLVADKETADNCYLNMDGVWAMALPSFQRLVGTGEDFNHAAGNLIQLCERIRESLVKMTIANDKETLYE